MMIGSRVRTVWNLSLKVPMKRNFLFFHMEEHKKLESYRSFISYLVSELQSFENTKIKAKKY